MSKIESVVCADGVARATNECLRFRDKYYSLKDRNIVTDFISNKPIHISSASKILSKIVLSPDGNLSDSQSTYSFTIERIEFPVIATPNGNVYPVMTEDIILNSGYIECIKSGYFCHPKDKSKHDRYLPLHKFNFTKLPDRVDNNNKASATKFNIKYGMFSPTYLATEGKKYTFGVELESIRGIVPDYIGINYNWQAAYDGSLKDENGNSWGAEYVTGVLTGDTGLLHLKQMCNELSKRCELDKKCSVHVHIGDININNTVILALFFLARILEEEIALLVPPSRRNNSYCRKINYKPSFHYSRNNTMSNRKVIIDDAYDELFKILSCKSEAPNIELNSHMQHPMGSKCNYNHDTPRYWWFNMIPLAFNTRNNESAKTLEFRNHSASFNFIKIKNWVKMCMAFVNYGETNYESIFMAYEHFMKTGVSEITMNDVILHSYPKYGHKLISYFDQRKDLFTSDRYSEASEYKEGNLDKSNSLKSIM